MKFAIAWLFVALSTYVAFANHLGCFGAFLRRRKGNPGSYSNVPLLSIVFSLAAWGMARDSIGWWVIVPALVDPGTWTLAVLPFYLLWRRFQEQD